MKNLLTPLERTTSAERIESLLRGSEFELQRIVSTGQTTPAGAWYDQETEEWVVLLQGAATIRFEEHAAPRALKPGDFFNIPAHSRHRLEWTDPEQETIWLTLHYRPSEPSP